MEFSSNRNDQQLRHAVLHALIAQMGLRMSQPIIGLELEDGSYFKWIVTTADHQLKSLTKTDWFVELNSDTLVMTTCRVIGETKM